jgi:hypothetical protein
MTLSAVRGVSLGLLALFLLALTLLFPAIDANAPSHNATLPVDRTESVANSNLDIALDTSQDGIIHVCELSIEECTGHDCSGNKWGPEAALTGFEIVDKRDSSAAVTDKNDFETSQVIRDDDDASLFERNTDQTETEEDSSTKRTQCYMENGSQFCNSSLSSAAPRSLHNPATSILRMSAPLVSLINLARIKIVGHADGQVEAPGSAILPAVDCSQSECWRKYGEQYCKCDQLQLPPALGTIHSHQFCGCRLFFTVPSNILALKFLVRPMTTISPQAALPLLSRYAMVKHNVIYRAASSTARVKEVLALPP